VFDVAKVVKGEAGLYQHLPRNFRLLKPQHGSHRNRFHRWFYHCR
jgi:hypothetical protein